MPKLLALNSGDLAIRGIGPTVTPPPIPTRPDGLDSVPPEVAEGSQVKVIGAAAAGPVPRIAIRPATLAVATNAFLKAFISNSIFVEPQAADCRPQAFWIC